MVKNFDYSKTMVMKLLLSTVENEKCKVFMNFEKALEIIKTVDNLTCQCPKIIYLVGWQYDGHDDKYPAFFAVNERLKRKCDDTAEESLIWLFKSAKKYNTTISLHINVTDAYPISPLWEKYLSNDLILKNYKNDIKATGTWNGRTAYQVRTKAEYQSGLFKERVDKLFEVLPIKEMATIHIDAFFVKNGKKTRIKEERKYRLKMIDYFNALGVDVTSEFIYREWNIGFRAHFGKSDTIGVIPYFWNPVLSRKDIIKYPSSVLAGGNFCKSLTFDKSIEWLIYGNIHGEDIFEKEDFEKEFIKAFVTYNLPYFYLNQYKRQEVKGFGENRQLIHENTVISYIKDKKITKNNAVLKFKHTLCLPISWKNSAYVAYSDISAVVDFYVEGNLGNVYIVDKNGKNFLGQYSIYDNYLCINAEAEVMYYIEVTEVLL